MFVELFNKIKGPRKKRKEKEKIGKRYGKEKEKKTREKKERKRRKEKEQKILYLSTRYQKSEPALYCTGTCTNARWNMKRASS